MREVSSERILRVYCWCGVEDDVVGVDRLVHLELSRPLLHSDFPEECTGPIGIARGGKAKIDRMRKGDDSP